MSETLDSYREFLATRAQLDGMAGFEPLWMPDFLFGFQQAMTGWAIRQGRGALFEDCWFTPNRYGTAVIGVALIAGRYAYCVKWANVGVRP